MKRNNKSGQERMFNIGSSCESDKNEKGQMLKTKDTMIKIMK